MIYRILYSEIYHYNLMVGMIDYNFMKGRRIYDGGQEVSTGRTC